MLTLHSNNFNEDFNLDVFAPVPSLYLAISWFVRTIRLIASEIYKKNWDIIIKAFGPSGITKLTTTKITRIFAYNRSKSIDIVNQKS